MDEEYPILNKLLKDEGEISKDNISYFHDYIPYWERLTNFVRMSVDIIGAIKDQDRWGFFLYDFLRRIEEAAVTSFSMLLKGYPNQSLLCLRPALEATGYAWHISQKIPENLKLWHEYHTKEAKHVKIEKELYNRFRQTFKSPKFPKEIYPLYALNAAYDRSSEISAHVGIPSSIMYYAFDTGMGHHYLIGIAGIIVETLRNISAVIGEICTKSFPSLPWHNLDKGILGETPHFLIRKRLEKMIDDVREIIETDRKIFIKSERTKARIDFAVLGLRAGPFANKLIEMLESKEWATPKERERAEKVILIIKKIISERPKEEVAKFENTESEFLKPIDDFLDFEKI